MNWFKQSTAASLIVGPILDSTGAEYASAVIGDLSISKNGGTLTALAATATLTYIANGQYTLALTTGNTDTLGRADITCNKSTYQMPPVRISVLQATVFDVLITNATTAAGGLGDIQRMAGTALTGRDIGASVLLSSGTGTGQLKLASGYVAMTWADIAAPTTTVNLSGTTIATTQKVDVETIKTNPVVNAGTITFPTGATLASTTNITAGTITTVTTVTNQLTAAQIATGVWTDTTASDFTTALSIGKSIMNGVSLGTGLTINGYTGNTVQTGDAYARIGAAGAGLTAIGDTRIANLDATVSSRGTSTLTQTQVTGGAYALNSASFSFNAALDFSTTQKTSLNSATPAVTVSDKTGFSLLAGSFVTATFGTCDFTTTQKTSITTAATAATPTVTAGTVSDKTGYSLSSTQTFSVTGDITGNLSGSVGSVTGLTASNLDTTVSSRLASASYTAPDNTNIGVAATQATTAATNTGTLLTNLAALAAKFTGITLVAQWLGLIAGKQVGNTTARTELNATGAGSGTYDETTDSTQAIRDRGDTAWGSSGGLTQADVRTAIGMASANLDTQLAGLSAASGTGAWTVAVTVNDGATVLESARVRFTKGAETYTTTTNASGVATFYLDSGTWTVVITLAGYTFASTTLAVAASTTHTYSMTLVTITPSSAGKTTGYLTAEVNGVPTSGVKIYYRAAASPITGLSPDGASNYATSDSNGLVQITNLTKGQPYYFWRGSARRTVDFTVPADAGSTCELPGVLGTD